MPELPDVTVYAECLTRALEGAPVTAVRIASPFFLRSVALSPASLVGAKVEAVTGSLARLSPSRRIVTRPPPDGRGAPNHSRGRASGAPGQGRPRALTDRATVLDRASSKNARASTCPEGRSRRVSRRARRATPLRRAQRRSRPALFTGIGNAYSDGSCTPKLSPFALSTSLDDAAARGRSAARGCSRSRAITATPPARAPGHGLPRGHIARRYSPAQGGAHPLADNEANYCPVCQTGGRLLADRALSRLLKDDFPRTLDDLEAHLDARRRP